MTAKFTIASAMTGVERILEKPHERDAALVGRAFLAIGFAFGLLFCVLNPPFQLDDEYAHMFRVYELSTGQLITRQDERGEYSTWPDAGARFLKRYKYLRKAPDKHFNPEKLYEDFESPWSEEEQVRVDAHAASYSPVCYVPQLAAVGLARAFVLPAPYHLYLGRFFALCTYLAFGYYSLRISKHYRYALFVLALMPMALWQGSGVTADCMTNGLCMLLLAWFIRQCLYESAKFSRKDFAVTATLLALLGLCKFIYVLFGLLFIALPAARFSNLRHRLGVLAGLALASALPCAAWLYAHGHGRPGEPPVDPEMNLPNASQQLELVLYEPWRVPLAVFELLRDEGWLQIRMFVGHFGRVNAEVLYLPSWLVAAFLALILLVAWMARVPETRRFDKRALAALVITAASITALILLGLYLVVTEVGGDKVIGMQGRYLIPVAMICVVAFASRFSPLHDAAWRRWTPHVAISGTLVALLTSVVVLLRAYYL